MKKVKTKPKQKYTPLEKLLWEYVNYWVKELRLENWKITIKVRTDAKEFDKYASASHSLSYQTVRLEFLDPTCYPEKWEGAGEKQDLEVTVVHELLHTRFIYCITKRSHFEEMAIETLSQTLIAHKRGVTVEELQ